MNRPQTFTRYNQPIPDMQRRMPSGLRLGWLTSVLAATVFLHASLFGAALGDSARQLAHKIAAYSGPGAFTLTITNRSSLDDKALHEARSALENELNVEGVHATKADQSTGTIEIVLSESLREYVWTAEITVGSDEKKVALVSLPRPPTAAQFSAALPVVLKTTLIFAQQQAMLDFAVVEMPGGFRLIVLDGAAVSIYRHSGTDQSANSIGRWNLEASLPIIHARVFPRDLRGRLLLRRDHLFDVYLPGTFCRSTSNAGAPLTLTCNETDDPWPLTPDDGSVRAFFAASRNFFTGTLSPPIGKISNAPSFYSAAAMPRSNYTLWAFAAVDGSLHLIDGTTDQLIRSGTLSWGSDLAPIHSNCGTGTQLLISAGNSPERADTEGDSLRAFEIPDREPLPVSTATEFGGQIVAVWPDTSGNAAAVIVKRKSTGWYEAYRISISCGN
jgi:hypothetical protein